MFQPMINFNAKFIKMNIFSVENVLNTRLKPMKVKIKIIVNVKDAKTATKLLMNITNKQIKNAIIVIMQDIRSVLILSQLKIL